MYNIFLDNTQIFDLPNGLDKLSIEVIREDGFQNTDQILRERTSTELEFIGDGYKYIANNFKSTNCTIINVTIYKICEEINIKLFEGKIHGSDINVKVGKSTITTPIRDSSYTGLVKDFIKTDVPLYYSRTKNCLDLSRIEKIVKFFKPVLPVNVLSFDVLDVLNYQVKYATDNKLYVVSNYLTTNKYLITTGFNLHNKNGGLQQKYPKLSFNTLFLELRKKFRLYIVTKFDVNGNPFLSIEQEFNAYGSTVLLNITDLPDGITEVLDKSRLYNSIEVGSSKNELTDIVFNRYTESNPINSFDKSVFSSCGECTVNNDSEQNKLDLVSDFIIDSDVIYDALAKAEGAQYEYDSEIFLVEYELISGVPYAKRTLIGALEHYNISLINNNVIDRWLGFSPQCLALSRYSTDYFKIGYINYEADFEALPGGVVYIVDPLNLPTTTSDINNTINKIYEATYHNIFVNTIDLPSQTISRLFTFYKCSKAGTYNYFLELLNIHQIPAGSPAPNVDYYAYITVYSDDTFTTILSQYSTFVNSINNATVNIQLSSGNIPISINNCVVATIDISPNGGLPVGFITKYVIDEINFFNNESNYLCEEFENEIQDSKSRLINFKYPLCMSDYLFIKDNKDGIINVNNKPFYIKHLKYIENNLSEFELIGNQSIIDC